MSVCNIGVAPVAASDSHLWEGTVSSSGEEVVSPILEYLKPYRIVATGFFWYNNPSNLAADAEYYSTYPTVYSEWRDHFPAPGGRSFLQINGEDIDWGPFNNGKDGHTYSIYYTGEGGPITFRIVDQIDDDYSDNYCHLTLRIYEDVKPRIPLMTLIVWDALPKVGQNIALTTKLTSVDDKLVVNQTIQFYLNSTSIGSGTTDKYGLATLTFKVELNPGTYPIVAYRAGFSSPLLSQRRKTAMLTVMAISTSLALHVPPTVPVGKSTVVNAILTDEFGSPVKDELIDFYINVGGVSSKVGSAYTNSQGIAFINYVFDKAGVFQLKATYSGASKVKYSGSDATATITVNPLEEAITTRDIVLIALAVIGIAAVLLAKRRSRKSRA